MRHGTVKEPILLIQGAQWGSEAKGTIAAWLCLNRNINYAVRTGGVNAGHTVIHKGKIYKMQQLPTGWVNPETKLVLGAGAYIHPEILQDEIDQIDAVMGQGSTARRLTIDTHAGLHSPLHQEAASKEGRHVRLGATGKGVTEAIVDKIKNRGNGAKSFLDFVTSELHPWVTGVSWADTSELLNNEYDKGAKILLEGTQGHLLDLHYGPWPYTTGKQTVAAIWLAEAGLSPRLEYEIVSVVRTYPIRVAGNSGPMRNEMSWPTLAREINAKLDIGMDPRVREESLAAFERAVAVTAIGKFRIPDYSDGLDQHMWPADDRRIYAAALSSINADAMAQVRDGNPTAYADLCRLFEFTTVTRKLRRIARLSEADIATSCLRDRPSWLAVTFLNYEFPNLWNCDKGMLHHTWSKETHEYLRMVSTAAGAPIRMVNTGPLLDHVSEVFVAGQVT